MKKRIILLHLLFFLLPFVGNSQSYSTPDIQSFGNDGNIMQKSLSTGSMMFNIPLFSYSDNGADLSVGIVYETSGMQVDRVASDVGLGWELSIGGHITREVRGIFEDEHDGTQITTAPKDKGYWYGDATARLDSECDVFYLTLGSRSMKFMISNTGATLIVPLNNIKVERYVGTSLVSGTMTSCTSPLTFVITDESGNKYYFSGSRWNDNVITEWSISKVITYDGRETDYTYITNTSDFVGPHYQVWQEKNQNFGAVQVEQHDLRGGNKQNDISQIKYPNGVTVNFIYTTPRYDIKEASHGVLDQVQIVESNWTYSLTPIQYSYSFNHSYFLSPSAYSFFNYSDYTSWNNSGSHANYTTSPSAYSSLLRLKLDKIVANGKDGSTHDFYSFDYSPVPLPAIFSGGFDKYGYSNGNVANSYTSPGTSCPTYLTIPKHYINPTSSTLLVGMDQSIGAVGYISACILNKLTNASGGILSLSYNSINNFGINVGGLAVTTTRKSDGYNSDNDIISSYTYADGEKFFSNEGDPIIYSVNERDYNTCLSSRSHFSWINFDQGGVTLNTGLNGSNFCFKTVTEQILDHSNNLISKTINKYSGLDPGTNGIPDNSCYTSIPGWTLFGNMPYTNKQYINEWGTMALLNSSFYDNNSNLIYTEEYQYQYINNYPAGYPDFQCYHSFTFPNGESASSYGPRNSDGTLTGTSINVTNPMSRFPGAPDYYWPVTGKLLLIKTIKNQYYTNTGYMQSQKEYSYDNAPHYNIILTKYTNSKGEQITSNTYYNYNFTSAGSGINKFNSDGVEHLIYTDKWKLVSGTNKLIGLNCSGYQLVGSVVRPSFNYSLATLATAAISSSYTPDLLGMSNGGVIPNFKLTGAITGFDDKGFAIEQSDKAGNTADVYHSQIFDDETGNSLAEAFNARHNDIAYCGFESNYAYAYNYGNVGFNPNGISPTHHLLGRLSFNCSGANYLSFSTLTVGKKYTISFWVLSGGTISADNYAGITYPLTVAGSYTVPATGEVWNLYKSTFTFTGSGLRVSGNAYVDEIKLYPPDCMMTTHNYLKMTGKTADVDVNDNITTYEYDAFNNLRLTRNKDGNIISKINTITQGN